MIDIRVRFVVPEPSSMPDRLDFFLAETTSSTRESWSARLIVEGLIDRTIQAPAMKIVACVKEVPAASGPEFLPNDSKWQSHPEHGRGWTAAFDVVEMDERSAPFDVELEPQLVEFELRLALLASSRRGLRGRRPARRLLCAAHPVLTVEERWRIELPPGAPFEADRAPLGRLAPGALDEAQVAKPTHARRGEGFLRHPWLVTVTGRFLHDDCLPIEPCTSSPYRSEDALEIETAAPLAKDEEAGWWFELESLDEARA